MTVHAVAIINSEGEIKQIYTPGGSIDPEGEYSFDKHVGTWTEFYKSGKKKREIKYNESAFDLNESFITREWNINGKLIYDRKVFVRE